MPDVAAQPQAAPQPLPAAPDGPPPQGEEPGTPWERRKQLGAFTAWKQTVFQALFEPGKLFAAARLDKGRDQLWFALLTGTAASLVSQLIGKLLPRASPEDVSRKLDDLKGMGFTLPAWSTKLMSFSAESETLGWTLVIAAFAPIMMLLLIYLNAGVTHASALLLGNARRGFAASFAASTYGLTPLVLAVIPVCGGPVALLWCAALIGVGLKHTHGLTTNKAAVTVIAPYILICCGGCLLTVTVAAMFGRSMGAMP